MTVGMRIYQRIRAAEDQANRLGFRFKSDTFRSRESDYFTLVSDGECLPCYRDGSEMFNGDLNKLESFLHGIDWARRYDLALGLKTDQRREKAEQRIRSQRTMDILTGKNDEQAKDFPF